MRKHRTMESPIGRLRISCEEDCIREVQFSGEAEEQQSREPVLLLAEEQLKAYFEGRLEVFDLPLEPVGTAFYRKVWDLLSEIPFGQTSTYGRLANQLENPGAIRAIGQANGRNPVAIIIPCHRVIGTDGSLTGYAGGLRRKQWLLQHEQAGRSGIQGELFS